MMSTPWPIPPFQVALVKPEIPPNTGNIARLCAATATPLHLVGPLGYRVTDRSLLRAGLDYWDEVEVHRHDDLDTFQPILAAHRFFLFSTKATASYTDVEYQPGDFLVFGSETRGLPEALREAHPEAMRGIPMQTHAVRSLNLATAVAIVLYEALRQVRGRNVGEAEG